MKNTKNESFLCVRGNIACRAQQSSFCWLPDTASDILLTSLRCLPDIACRALSFSFCFAVADHIVSYIPFVSPYPTLQNCLHSFAFLASDSKPSLQCGNKRASFLSATLTAPSPWHNRLLQRAALCSTVADKPREKRICKFNDVVMKCHRNLAILLGVAQTYSVWRLRSPITSINPARLGGTPCVYTRRIGSITIQSLSRCW
jgi:hypothetical protein